MKDFNHGDKSKLAKKLSVSNSHISEILILDKIPDEIKDYLVQKNIRKRAILRKVVSCSDIHQMKSLLRLDDKIKNREEKRKFIYTFFIKNGEVYYQDNSYKLTEKQKTKIKECFSNILESLKN